MSELEEKLTFVRDGLYHSLSEKELNNREYRNTTLRLLQKQGMATDGSSHENVELSGTIATYLVDSLGLLEERGLLQVYVHRKDVLLSKEARGDVSDYNLLLQGVKERLDNTVGSKRIGADDFRELCINYIEEDSLFNKINDEFDRAETRSRVRYKLVDNYSVHPQNEMVAGYHRDEMIDIIRNMPKIE